jgi:hypothetical protein
MTKIDISARLEDEVDQEYVVVCFCAVGHSFCSEWQYTTRLFNIWLGGQINYERALNTNTKINILLETKHTYTYDHRSVKTGHPVRSAIHKH